MLHPPGFAQRWVGRDGRPASAADPPHAIALSREPKSVLPDLIYNDLHRLVLCAELLYFKLTFYT